MAERVGQQIGSYRLLRLLGKGGFAEVYLGEHLHLGTQAAIKVLSTRLSPTELEHFRDEARTIARLQHPQIVRVLDFGVERGEPFLVLEYAPGGTLRQRHPKGSRLTPDAVLPYVQQMASALQYAHEQKLIHRDVKPENMLLDAQGHLLLSDFGIALVAQSSRYHSPQEVAGTLAYMAPEQIQGNPRRASDQYSLGVVIYEWLAGARPFSGGMSEIVAQHLSASPRPLREQVPNLSPALEQVVLTALAKDPRERFASMQAFATAFQQALAPSTLSLPLHPSPDLGLSSSPPNAVSPMLPTRAPRTLLPAPPPSGPEMSPPGPSWVNAPTVVSASHQSSVPTSVTPAVPPKHPKHHSVRVLAALVLVALLLTSGGLLWRTLSSSAGTGTKTNVVPGTITEFPVSGAVSLGSITANSDGALWFLDGGSHTIGRITLAGVVTTYPLSVLSSSLDEITASADGNLWFTEADHNRIGWLTPARALTEFVLPAGSTPEGITIGPEGTVWFTEFDGNRIGRITSAGQVAEFPLPTPRSGPRSITTGPDGALWFTEFDGNRIGRITPDGNITEFPLHQSVPTPDSQPRALVTGPDGTLWFTESGSNQIGRITSAGVVTEFPVPTAASGSWGIAVGPDGNLWFTEQTGNQIGRITPHGRITEFALPTPESSPGEITKGRDGNLWFTESGSSQIGRITSGA